MKSFDDFLKTLHDDDIASIVLKYRESLGDNCEPVSLSVSVSLDILGRYHRWLTNDCSDCRQPNQ